MEILKILPKNALSRMVGEFAEKESPSAVTRTARDWFIKRYKINMDEAELPLEAYPSIAKLFTRRLKPGVRPLGEGLVHPCDGVLTQAELIEDDSLIQAKGKKYSLTDLLQDKNVAETFVGGAHLVYYLCPTDYHRVHSPVDCEITEVVHVPGALWPVNGWSVKNISQLFSLNERVIYRMSTPLGPAALVMVGATNVGKITVSFDSSMVTNRKGQSQVPFQKTYASPVVIRKGDELGVFNMGSTVVMIYGPRMVNVLPKVGPVKWGKSL